MLDNISIPQLRDVVAHRHVATTSNVVLEASGTITLSTARAIAETGVKASSVGALTHSAPALDLIAHVSGSALSEGQKRSVVSAIAELSAACPAREVG